jgi:hypothetical protein
LGSGIPRHMTTTCSKVAVIQIFLSLIIGEIEYENKVNTTPIKSVTNNYVLTGLIPYMMTVCARKVGPESLSLEIDDNISVPSVIRTDQKKGFIRQGILCHIFYLIGGKVTHQFGENQ